MYRLVLATVDGTLEWSIESAGTGEYETFEDALNEANKRNDELREESE